jgi:hypothetical protein
MARGFGASKTQVNKWSRFRNSRLGRRARAIFPPFVGCNQVTIFQFQRMMEDRAREQRRRLWNAKRRARRTQQKRKNLASAITRRTILPSEYFVLNGPYNHYGPTPQHTVCTRCGCYLEYGRGTYRGGGLSQEQRYSRETPTTSLVLDEPHVCQ